MIYPLCELTLARGGVANLKLGVYLQHREVVALAAPTTQLLASLVANSMLALEITGRARVPEHLRCTRPSMDSIHRYQS